MLQERIVFSVALATVLGAVSPTMAHDSNCDNSTAGDPIHCEQQDNTSTDDISIDVESIDIDTTADNDDGRGVYADHRGSGDVTIDVSGTTTTPSKIDTTGDYAYGIRVLRSALSMGGDVDITVENTEITTAGSGAYGISGRVDTFGGLTQGNRNMKIQLGRGTRITTSGTSATGVHSYFLALDGDLEALLDGVSITTTGDTADAVLMQHAQASPPGLGDLLIDLTDVNLITEGLDSYGVHAQRGGTGALEIRAPTRGGSIVTKGEGGRGIFAKRRGDINTPGHIIIDLTDMEITTESTAGDNRLEPGVSVEHQRNGNTEIDLRGGFVKTKGDYSYGVYALYIGSSPVSNRPQVFGNIDIATHDDHAITNTGANGHGIVAYHFGTADTDRQIDVTVGGTIDVSGTDAQGVRIGAIGATGPERMAALDNDGFRRQTVTVNNQIKSDGEGVYLVNGGRVILGPRARFDSAKNIAILATGTVPAVEDDASTTDIDESMDAIPPKLRVDFNLSGTSIATVLGDDWIVNDGGRTDIFVNGTGLHDGSTGATGNTARNGVYNVTLRPDGLTVTDRTTDPWTLSARSDTTINDRDFSTEDFTETRVRCRPGLIGFPNCRRPPPPEPEPEPEPPPVEIVEVYAPRAALYEAAPDMLARMQAGLRGSRPTAERWLTVDRSWGDHRLRNQVVGADYDMNRTLIEAGSRIASHAWVSIHHLASASDIAAPTGGGDMRISGTGMALDALFENRHYYAHGRFAFTDYSLSFTSDDADVGRLRGGVDGFGTSMNLEAGRHMGAYTPHAWLARNQTAIDSFTDSVGAHASFAQVTRLVAGLGIEARYPLLRATLGLETMLSGSGTATRVSGERLHAHANEHAVRFDVAKHWQRGPFTISAQLATRNELGGEEEYAVNLGLRWQP